MHYTVTDIFKSEHRIKGSKFYSVLTNIECTDDAESFLFSIKKEHPVATHHCYAYLLNPQQPLEFTSDDGEPGGTAGLPILNAMKSSGLINSMIVVIRYYGGTKLGKSGLIDAYSTAAQKVIDDAVLKKLIFITQMRIKYKYENQSFIDKLKNDFPIIEMNAIYLDSVELTVGIPKEIEKAVYAKLKSVKHQLLQLENEGDGYYILQD